VSLTSPAAAQTCAGDCGADGIVAVNELVQAVNIALDRASIDTCANVDTDADQRVSINELVTAVNNLVRGCNGAATTPTASATPDLPTPTPTSDEQVPPTTNPALIAWLQAGRYQNWAAEGGQHPSSGPHFGNVRTFVNQLLFESLDAAEENHPVGAAAVKELFGRTGTAVRGWGVSIKVQDGAGGSGWYWLEYYEGSVIASGAGNGICTGCHNGGTDYVCTPYPLQPGGQTLPPMCP
jgi:hypothetical protein